MKNCVRFRGITVQNLWNNFVENCKPFFETHQCTFEWNLKIALQFVNNSKKTWIILSQLRLVHFPLDQVKVKKMKNIYLPPLLLSSFQLLNSDNVIGRLVWVNVIETFCALFYRPCCRLVVAILVSVPI